MLTKHGTITNNKFSPLNNHSETYFKLYLYLKGQRTIISSLCTSLSSNLQQQDIPKPNDSSDDSSDENENEANQSESQRLLRLIHKILHFDLHDIIFDAPSIMTTLSKIIDYKNDADSQREAAPKEGSINLNKIKNLLITACVSFIKFQSMMISHLKFSTPTAVPVGAISLNHMQNSSDHQFDLSTKNSNVNSGSDNSPETLICRLCNEHINADLFDEHIQSCAIAFKSNLKVKDINAALSVQIDEISNRFLSGDWPGDLNQSISIIFPMLHLCILLKQAIDVDASSPDAPDELESIELSVLHIPICDSTDDDVSRNQNRSSQLRKSRITTQSIDIDNETAHNSRQRGQTLAGTRNDDISINKKFYATSTRLIQDKIKLSLALNSARNVLKNTRISGSNRISEIVKMTDFVLLKQISAGAYARVFLARMKKTGDIFAIKVTPRSSLKHKNEVSRLITEKDIMLQFSNPYIVNFYYSINGKNNLYLVMEYLPGGDLYSLLQGVGSFDERTAKIYTLEILQALIYLRKNGIVHRDLKPDNVLISSSGKIRLADFGLSHLGLVDRQTSSTQNDENNPPKSSENTNQQQRSHRQTLTKTKVDVNSNSNTITIINNDDHSSAGIVTNIIGTPDYIAPEILMNNPHNYTADYWSLGCMLFEFLIGIPPFHAATENETFKNILTGKMLSFEDPDVDPEEETIEISSEVKDLISKLLEPNPRKRLGFNSIDEILHHPWFSEFESVDIDTIDPPFKPQLKAADDTEYFMQRYAFTGKNDEDILEDIAVEFDESEENNDNDNRISLVKKPRRRSGSIPRFEGPGFSEIDNDAGKSRHKHHKHHRKHRKEEPKSLVPTDKPQAILKEKRRRSSQSTHSPSSSRKSKEELLNQFQAVGIDQIMKKNEEVAKERSTKRRPLPASNSHGNMSSFSAQSLVPPSLLDRNEGSNHSVHFKPVDDDGSSESSNDNTSRRLNSSSNSLSSSSAGNLLTDSYILRNGQVNTSILNPEEPPSPTLSTSIVMNESTNSLLNSNESFDQSNDSSKRDPNLEAKPRQRKKVNCAVRKFILNNASVRIDVNENQIEYRRRLRDQRLSLISDSIF